MVSLTQVFKGQVNVWSAGKQLSSYFVHLQRGLATEIKEEEQQVKRPAAVFALFLKAEQSTIKEQNPTLKQPQIMKLVSKMWREAGPDTQQQYRNIFERKMVEYKANIKEVSIPIGPRRPFVQFYSDKMGMLSHSHPTSVTERTKKAGLMWSDLPIFMKERYRTTYRNKLLKYTNDLSEEEKQEIKERKERKKERKDALNLKRQRREVRRYGKEALVNRPIAPPTNPYTVFVREVKGTGEMVKGIGEKWRNLSQEERGRYKQQVDQSVKTYEKELALWQKENDRRSESL